MELFDCLFHKYIVVQLLDHIPSIGQGGIAWCLLRRVLGAQAEGDAGASAGKEEKEQAEGQASD